MAAISFVLAVTPASSAAGLVNVSQRKLVFLLKNSFMRLVKHGDGVAVQAKICTKCEQLVLTYPQTMRCVVCGGILKVVKKND